MKKFLCTMLILILTTTTAFAAYEEHCFTVNGFEYKFSFATIEDSFPVKDNAGLWISSYYGTKLIDINTVVPTGLYVHEILAATGLQQVKDYDGSYYNWTPHLNEFVPADSELITYDSRLTADVKMSVDGENFTTLVFPDQKPIIVNNRIQLPVRAVAEYFNWTVTWNPGNGNTTISNGTRKIVFGVGSETLDVWENGKQLPWVKPDDAVMALNGRMVVPIRAVGEALGLSVNWNAEENCVYLTKN